MFTQCPDCERQFRIRADQLTAAEGQVKCGYCGSQFNALLSLRDQPVPPPTETGPAVSTEVTETPGERTAPPESGVITNEPQFTLPDELVALQSNEVDTAPGDTQIDIEQGDQVDQIPDKEQITQPQYDFPENYLEDSAPQPGRRSRVLWGLGSVMLMLVLLLQAGWFFRDRVLSRYPQLTPYVKQLCQRVDCRITRQPKFNQIQLLNRDVRDHPRYEDSLLVNATMINSSQNVQPFPRIRLSLFDTNGKVISWRLFRPGEYLDDSIDLEAGMSREVPVHFVLEVTGPTEGAVSFEFDFLDG